MAEAKKTKEVSNDGDSKEISKATTAPKSGAVKEVAKAGKHSAKALKEAEANQAKEERKAEIKSQPEDTKPKVVRNQPTRKPRSKRSGSQKR